MREPGREMLLDRQSGDLSLVPIIRNTELWLVATPAPLCHKDTAKAQGTQTPLLGAFLAFRCVFMAYGWLPSTERRTGEDWRGLEVSPVWQAGVARSPPDLSLAPGSGECAQ